MITLGMREASGDIQHAGADILLKHSYARVAVHTVTAKGSQGAMMFHMLRSSQGVALLSRVEGQKPGDTEHVHRGNPAGNQAAQSGPCCRLGQGASGTSCSNGFAHKLIQELILEKCACLMIAVAADGISAMPPTLCCGTLCQHRGEPDVEELGDSIHLRAKVIVRRVAVGLQRCASNAWEQKTTSCEASHAWQLQGCHKAGGLPAGWFVMAAQRCSS
jgi:hypothetical protein